MSEQNKLYLDIVDVYVSTENLDKDQLMKQALNLFGKRYSKSFETHMNFNGTGKVTKEEYMKKYTKLFGPELIEKATYIAEQQWLAAAGGDPELKELTKESGINCSFQAYHSNDKEKRDRLIAGLLESADFHFDLLDSNHDGFINEEEWEYFISSNGDLSNWEGVFAILDLNGDGLISRAEWKQVTEGFFCSVDQERYSHFLGLLKDY